MHIPDAQPRPSVFYDYRLYPAFDPAARSDRPQASVVIVGAGPIGMLTALDLARFGVASIVLEQDRQVSHGSRALALTRRSMEIIQQAGVADRFVAKGYSWKSGRSFFRGREVYRMQMPHDPDDRFWPAINIQQQYIEEYLVDAIEQNPLIELRWGCKVTAVTQSPEAVDLRINTQFGEYALSAEWLIAADGGRSAIRKMLDLKMEGKAYRGNFVIADIKADLPLPTERLCFFDPEWSPGNNALIHRAPDGMWRFDFRLPEGQSPEQALEPDRLRECIGQMLRMLGYDTAWELDWATVYSASALTLPDYVCGRVLFTGDAAHLLPIFGVRGANTGFQDGENLAWKLAWVVKKIAPPELLQSYSLERVQAAREICDEAGKTTRFMTPPTSGFRLMRNAVLSLSLTQEFPRDLLHWRTSRPHIYSRSPLNSFPDDDAAFAGGPGCGQSIWNVKLGEDDFLLDRMAAGFHLMCFSGPDGLESDMRDLLQAARNLPIPAVTLLVARKGTVDMRENAEIFVEDPEGRVAEKYAAPPGSAYLFRPDLHVCARWPHPTPAKVMTAIDIASGRQCGHRQ